MALASIFRLDEAESPQNILTSLRITRHGNTLLQCCFMAYLHDVQPAASL